MIAEGMGDFFNVSSPLITYRISKILVMYVIESITMDFALQRRELHSSLRLSPPGYSKTIVC